MDIVLLVARARDSYVEQFRAFAKDLHSKCKQGAAEVKIETDETTGLFDRLSCVDFVMNDGQLRVVELAPADNPSFDPVEGKYGSVSLLVSKLQWDDIVIRHDVDELPQDQLRRWFERWFDTNDVRYEEGADILRIVHSLWVQPRMLSIDFGTAEAAALWEMIDLLRGAGASTIDIDGSRAETVVN